MRICNCGHTDHDHRHGHCVAIVHTRLWLSQGCPCSKFIAAKPMKIASR